MKLRNIVIGVSIGFALTQLFDLLGILIEAFRLPASITGYNWGVTFVTLLLTASIPFFIGATISIIRERSRIWAAGLTVGALSGFWYTIQATFSLARMLVIQEPALAGTVKANVSFIALSIALGGFCGLLAAFVYKIAPGLGRLDKYLQ